MTETLTELREWLMRDVDDPVEGWAPMPPYEDLHCHRDLVERLAEISKPAGAVRRVFVGGCPVIHHPRGRAVAAAWGTSWLTVCSGSPAGALATGNQPLAGLDAAWVMLDPWAADVALSRTIDLLRAHIVRAYELAERAA
jgi:hypothetical protein